MLSLGYSLKSHIQDQLISQDNKQNLILLDSIFANSIQNFKNYRMEQTQLEANDTKVQIIESTCLFNRKLNKNNAIDGTNIIYLAGASIVFHNIFQNSKKFISRISDTHVIGMSFFKSSENIVALATKYNNSNSQNQNNQLMNKNSKKLNIELYVLGEEGVFMAELNQNIEFIDMEFLDKKTIILLAKQNDEFYFYILQMGKKLKKKSVNIEKPTKFIAQDRRICVLGSKGMKDFDAEIECLSSQLRFEDVSIEDYAIIDNQFEIILSQNKLLCYHDHDLIHQVFLNDSSYSNARIQAKTIVRVGRNLLVAHRNAITLSHFIIDNNRLKFLINYTYKQKIKGGVLGMEVSFDQMHLAMSVQIIEKDCTKIQNFMFNLSILSSEKKFINPFIRLIPLGTQSSQINSLQGVIPFETYYLAGNTIVNYSYNDQVQKKFKFSLHETPKQFAAHPLGHQFACVFETQIKFYLKIQNQIVQIWNEQMICSYAKYTTCGHLLLACLEDNFYQLVVYETNSFKRLKNIPNVYIKHPITKIQLAEHDSQVVLYVGHDLSIYKLKNGEKIAEYRQKKQKQEISSIAYDPSWMTLLASTTNKSLIFCKKVDDVSWQFKFQKIITLTQQITCILINPVLETVFMGTKSGKLIWTQYPLNLVQNQDMKYNFKYQQIRLSQQAINQIHLTNNLKYLYVSFKTEGLVICKLRKIVKYQVNTRYNEFDISNLNFLQTSSKNSLQSGFQKLKTLLQKRKTVFNDLGQYKKEWQMKKNKKIKAIDSQNKHKELNHINQALSQVEKLKQQKNDCYEQLKQIQEQTQNFIKEKQQKYQRQIMLHYDENIDLRVRKQKVNKKCEEQYNMILAKCKTNIQQIDQELKQKYDVFMQNYAQMKTNLSLYQKRLQIERQQAHQILLQLFAEKMQKLGGQQLEQKKRSNQLKALITKCKKQSERFESRRYFLQSKHNFFLEQLNFCKGQKRQLIDIKQQLEDQLKELEILTNKKERRLRKYFKQNQILTKYQLIHNNLVTNLGQEVKFFDEQKFKTSKNIVSIQKELSEVAELNEKYHEKIEVNNKKMLKIKQKTYASAEKTRYLAQIILQMSEAIDNIKVNLNDQNKASLFGQIYRDFYISRKLEKIIQSTDVVDPSKQQQQIEFKIFNSTENKKKVLQNMKKHKDYLEKNMMLFQKHNNKSQEQMNLTYLKYQTQNYNLIAECNVRKQQTNKKKRILHELIDSVKQTELYMNQLQKQNFDQAKMLRSASTQKSAQNIPFLMYKKNRQQIEKSRFKVIRKQESEPTLWKLRQSTYQVRKMLDAQKVKIPGSQNKLERRIKTAMIKNRNSDNTVHVQSTQFFHANTDSKSLTKKPMTATGKRHQAPFGQYYTYSGVKNNSASKPTTCTTHTNINKTSIYH